MTGRRGVARVGGLLSALAAVAVAAGLAITVGPVSTVGAQGDDSGPSLVVRSVDGRDPDAVRVEFLWTGDRASVSQLVVRENGSVVDRSDPVLLGEAERFGIVLAIDTSESMADNAAFERAQAAAKDFIAEKRPDDQIAVVGFNDVVQVAADFTDDVDRLRDAVDQLGVGGSTAIYDAVARSVSLFEDTDLVPNVVLLTDGGDESSDTSESTAASLLGDSNTLLHAIGIESGALDTSALERLTGSTGGSVLLTSGGDDLAEIYAEVQARIRRQFSTTFVSQSDSEGPTDLALTVGSTTGRASFTVGARLDSSRLVEPVPVPEAGGIGVLQNDVVLWLALVLVVAAAGGAVFAVGSAVTRDRPALERVLQPYSDGFVASNDPADDRLATSQILQRAVELTGQFAERRGVLQRIEDMLEQANLPLRAAEALFFHLVSAVILAVLGGVVSSSVVGFVLVLLVALAAPPAIVVVLARRRQAQFREQLPDLFRLMSSTLRSGYSLLQGVEAASQEVSEPTRRELQRVLSEARLGMQLEEALHNVSQRMSSRDFEWAVMAIGIQREVGGNLAELLDIVADTMQARERLRRDIRALTAEGRVSATVLGVLPIALGVMIYSVSENYLDPLFERGIGLVMVGGAAVLMVVGFWWMNRIIDIEV